MSIKDDLHTLIDQLGDDEAMVAFRYLREIVDSDTETPCRKVDERGNPSSMADNILVADKPQRDPVALAMEQGLLPLTSFDDLLGDFWPEDESVDDFIAEIRELRRQDGYA